MNGTSRRTSVAFGSLPPVVQTSIASQIPPGAQLGGVITELTPQGAVYRAQVVQNGIISEVTIAAPAPTAQTQLGTAALQSPNNLPTVGVPSVGGYAIATPYAYEQLPSTVQSAFAAQSGGVTVTNLTYSAGPSGGVYRGFANGQPLQIRTAADGSILPNPRVAASDSTNDIKFDDLPMGVRDSVRETEPFAEVTSIRKMESPSGDLYDLTLRSDGRFSMLQVSENGTIVREKSELSLAITTPLPLDTNAPPILAWATLPRAVKSAIEAQTDSKMVRSLVLTNFQAKTAYAVDYLDKDSLRNRLYIGKDGLVMDTQTNLYGIALTGKPIMIKDLPQPAREMIQDHADSRAITRIDLSMRGLTPVYVVSYRKDGEARQMVVTREGVQIEPAVGGPATAVTGQAQE